MKLSFCPAPSEPPPVEVAVLRGDEVLYRGFDRDEAARVFESFAPAPGAIVPVQGGEPSRRVAFEYRAAAPADDEVAE